MKRMVTMSARRVRGMVRPRMIGKEGGEGHASSHPASSHGQGMCAVITPVFPVVVCSV